MQSRKQHSRAVRRKGKTVRINIEMAAAEQWRLCISGADDQVSEWLELFRTPFEAMQAGLLAIDEEGIEGFHADPIFRCLKAAACALDTEL